MESKQEITVQEHFLILPLKNKVKEEKANAKFGDLQYLPMNMSHTIKKEKKDTLDIDSNYFQLDIKPEPLDDFLLKTDVTNICELLTDRYDLSPIKSEYLEHFDQPDTSQASQELFSTHLQECSRKKTFTKKKPKYPCPVCSKSCHSSKTRLNHFNRHFGKHLGMCKYCGMIFRRKSEFLKHYFNHFVKKILTRQFLKHFIVNYFKNRASLNCDTCYKSLKNNTSFKGHVLSHCYQNENPFKCIICRKAFIRLTPLLYHLKTHEKRSEKYVKNICLKKIKYNAYLKKHLEDSNKYFQCEFCFSLVCFPNFIHNCEKIFYDCHICCKRFFSIEVLNLHHLITHQKGNGMYFKCKFCHSILKKSNLYDHIQVYRNFKCKTCFKIFPCKFLLLEHQKIHTEKLECPMCSAQFAEFDSLNLHLKIHTKNNSKFKCGICSNLFSKKHDLYTHLQSHCT